MINQTAHFIWFWKDIPDFNFHHYICLKSFIQHNPETPIVFHVNKEFQSKYFDELKEHITVRYVTPAEGINGTKFGCLAHVSDYYRFNLLYDEGGMYFDMDTITIGNIMSMVKNVPNYSDKLMFSSCTYHDDFSCGALISLTPENRFLKEIINNYKNNYVAGDTPRNSHKWAFNSCHWPWQEFATGKYQDCAVYLNKEIFYPLKCYESYQTKMIGDIDTYIKSNTVQFHLYNSHVPQHIYSINEDNYLDEQDNMYANLIKRIMLVSKKIKEIGILYICTGRYSVLWKDFYASAEKHLFPDCIKTYYVWTDNDSIITEKNIVKFDTIDLGWPNATLLRNKLFLDKKDILNRHDYLMFYNGDSLFLKDIGIDEIMTAKHSYTALEHMYAWNAERHTFGYCKDQRSTSYITPTEGHHYFAGGIMGGWTKQFFTICEKCFDNIKKDLVNDITASFHDESQWNRIMENYIQKGGYPLILNPTTYGHYELTDKLKMRFRLKTEVLDVIDVKINKTNEFSFFKINCKSVFQQLIDYCQYLKIYQINKNMKMIIDSKQGGFCLDKLIGNDFLWENVLTTMDYGSWIHKTIYFDSTSNQIFNDVHTLFVLNENVQNIDLLNNIDIQNFPTNERFEKYKQYIQDEDSVIIEFDKEKYKQNKEDYMKVINGINEKMENPFYFIVTNDKEEYEKEFGKGNKIFIPNDIDIIKLISSGNTFISYENSNVYLAYLKGQTDNKILFEIKE